MTGRGQAQAQQTTTTATTKVSNADELHQPRQRQRGDLPILSYYLTFIHYFGYSINPNDDISARYLSILLKRSDFLAAIRRRRAFGLGTIRRHLAAATSKQQLPPTPTLLMPGITTTSKLAPITTLPGKLEPGPERGQQHLRSCNRNRRRTGFRVRILLGIVKTSVKFIAIILTTVLTMNHVIVLIDYIYSGSKPFMDLMLEFRLVITKFSALIFVLAWQKNQAKVRRLIKLVKSTSEYILTSSASSSSFGSLNVAGVSCSKLVGGDGWMSSCATVNSKSAGKGDVRSRRDRVKGIKNHDVAGCQATSNESRSLCVQHDECDDHYGGLTCTSPASSEDNNNNSRHGARDSRTLLLDDDDATNGQHSMSAFSKLRRRRRQVSADSSGHTGADEIDVGGEASGHNDTTTNGEDDGNFGHMDFGEINGRVLKWWLMCLCVIILHFSLSETEIRSAQHLWQWLDDYSLHQLSNRTISPSTLYIMASFDNYIYTVHVYGTRLIGASIICIVCSLQRENIESLRWHTLRLIRRYKTISAATTSSAGGGTSANCRCRERTGVNCCKSSGGEPATCCAAKVPTSTCHRAQPRRELANKPLNYQQELRCTTTTGSCCCSSRQPPVINHNRRAANNVRQRRRRRHKRLYYTASSWPLSSSIQPVDELDATDDSEVEDSDGAAAGQDGANAVETSCKKQQPHATEAITAASNPVSALVPAPIDGNTNLLNHELFFILGESDWLRVRANCSQLAPCGHLSSCLWTARCKLGRKARELATRAIISARQLLMSAQSQPGRNDFDKTTTAIAVNNKKVTPTTIDCSAPVREPPPPSRMANESETNPTDTSRLYVGVHACKPPQCEIAYLCSSMSAAAATLVASRRQQQQPSTANSTSMGQLASTIMQGGQRQQLQRQQQQPLQRKPTPRGGGDDDGEITLGAELASTTHDDKDDSQPSFCRQPLVISAAVAAAKPVGNCGHTKRPSKSIATRLPLEPADENCNRRLRLRRPPSVETKINLAQTGSSRVNGTSGQQQQSGDLYLNMARNIERQMDQLARKYELIRMVSTRIDSCFGHMLFIQYSFLFLMSCIDVVYFSLCFSPNTKTKLIIVSGMILLWWPYLLLYKFASDIDVSSCELLTCVRRLARLSIVSYHSAANDERLARQADTGYFALTAEELKMPMSPLVSPWSPNFLRRTKDLATKLASDSRCLPLLPFKRFRQNLGLNSNFSTSLESLETTLGPTTTNVPHQHAYGEAKAKIINKLDLVFRPTNLSIMGIMTVDRFFLLNFAKIVITASVMMIQFVSS